ncbi:stress response protein NST1-like [Abrus precatorius]|uniref:Stress response protein NST1-like n=1 Tax=Abrus precatorius TaxID=3816 RepID=A0A8B8LJM9_ABRPR|nr:stress response protein NST1-like [Abrus precatorius]XP_027355564.1 stress response protein NST1-like [Abrus precatorius]
MLKQSPNRNQRTKGFKVKQGLKIFTLIAVGIWLLYQLKHSYDKKSNEESSLKILENLKASIETKTLGRKGSQPWTNKPYELMDDTEENEHERVKEQSRGVEDYLVGLGHDRDKVVEEEENEEAEDLIDEEDKEKEEPNEEDVEDIGKHMEDMSVLEDQGHDDGEKDTQATSEEHYKERGASRVVMQVTQSLGSEFEFGGSRNVKGERVENSEKSVKEKQLKQIMGPSSVHTTDSSPKVVDHVPIEHGSFPNVLFERE